MARIFELKYFSISIFFGLIFLGLPVSSVSQRKNFPLLKKDFISGYEKLGIPPLTLDYKEYFSGIPSLENLNKQKAFFDSQRTIFEKVKKSALTKEETLNLDQILYEIAFNEERIRLETDFRFNKEAAPDDGLYRLNEATNWYRFFVKKFTGQELSGEQIMSFGKEQVAFCQSQISQIKKIKPDTGLFIRNKDILLGAFRETDSIVRSHLSEFFGTIDVPRVYAMEWPDAGANTPPGIYLNRSNNAYGKDVFQFNFYQGRFRRSSVDWLYLHEAIPGHHLQFSITKAKNNDPLQDLFSYPGSFEGWACYVEYFGKQFGLYRDDRTQLGKWEWDLVRSVRLVLDAGIHQKGWTHEQALAYWKENIKGQDEIAEREVTRVTNWPGQALSYKFGAKYIFDMKEKWLAKNNGKAAKNFHMAFLECGNVPLTVAARLLLNET